MPDNKPSFLKRMFFPFLLLTFNRENAKNAIFDGIENTKYFIKSADWRDKDIYSANMELADYYYNKHKFFDAKLRYRIASHFNKTAIEPLLGLAYIEISSKKYKKSVKYLKMALKKAKEGNDIIEIQELIKAVETRK
jgi:hypothetical protein